MGTINEDGTPAVSPKATFVVVDDACIAFGNIRSPGTVANIRSRPDVEVNFIDVSPAARSGRAEIVEGVRCCLGALGAVSAHMQCFVNQHPHAELVLSPAYESDTPPTSSNLDKLAGIG